MRKLILVFFALIFQFSYCQNYWKIDVLSKDEEKIDIVRDVKNVSLKSKNFTKKVLSIKENEFLKIDFPNEKGQLEFFSLMETKTLSKKIQMKYPNIRTFRGYSDTRKNVILRITFSPHGISGTLRTPKGLMFLQPLYKDSNTEHIFYRSSRYNFTEGKLFCKTNLIKIGSTIKKTKQIKSNKIINRAPKSFKIAIAASGEYTEFWGDNNDQNGTNSEDAFAAVVSTINRLNEIMEVDLGIRLLIVSDASLMYEDKSSDPFNSNFASEIHSTLSSLVGEENYDLGHLFHRGQASGDAGSVGNVCINDSKDRAYSAHPFTATNGSSGFFLNDYFDLDFVLHEVGHQFGATHTYAYDPEPFGVSSEPGSGSTIMSYAGFVSGENMQRHSDPYFHYHSIQDVESYVDNVSCHSNVNSINQKPTVSAGDDFYIPKGTAYYLEANGFDLDNDNLTYCWEQLDSGQVDASNFGPELLTGSINRSIPPSDNKIRYIPGISEILNGNLTPSNPTLFSSWETVSNVERTLTWGVTVRDRSESNPNGMGQISQDVKKIFVTATAGPFKITSNDSSDIIWKSGSNQKIIWDVANTNRPPINTDRISIFLSVDGGENFSIPLVENIPNSGEAHIIVPGNISTERARIKISADNNIYFAVNNSQFKIEERDFAFPFIEPEKISCGDEELTFKFNLKAYNNFNGDVEFELLDFPNQISYNISPTSLNSSGTLGSITINRNELPYGSYNMYLSGTSDNLTEEESFIASFYPDSISSPNLVSPKDNLTDANVSQSFEWSSVNYADNYRFELSTVEDFSSLVKDEKTIENKISISNLDPKQTYYWRVSAINTCGNSLPSSSRKFSTTVISCNTYTSDNIPVNLNDATSALEGITEVKVNVLDNLKIVDLNLELSIDHSYIQDLAIILISPEGNEVILTQNLGGTGINYTNTVFDSESPNPIQNASPPFTGIYKPIGNLKDLYDLNSGGDWTLRIIDQYPVDTGTLKFLELELCLAGEIKSNTDGDLIPNDEDNCPFVTNPDQADFNNNGVGDLCDLYDQRNIKISKKDATCSEKQNGEIQISAIAIFDYEVEISSGNGYYQTITMINQELLIQNLSPGTYQICVMEKDSSFQTCYITEISEPPPLNVTSKFNRSNKILSLKFEGGKKYIVSINGKKITTYEKEKDFNLNDGLNIIQVMTTEQCQGMHQENIFIGGKSQIYPNPSIDDLNILIGGDALYSEIEIIDIFGNIVYSEKIKLDPMSRHFKLDISMLTVGNYVLKINSNSGFETIKFIKK
ncbi:M12 family metallo-peptidase [Bacteroidota bacterium]|nr:M12 family metallo-peptidase [Bacteroidota bacterium]